MLDRMFQVALTDAEVKAIAKARSFPEAAVASRAAVGSMFESEVGVAEAVAALTRPEQVALRMLAAAPEPVDVSFFERLYHEANPDFPAIYARTFNQRYREVFKQVREQLVRKGVLFIFDN